MPPRPLSPEERQDRILDRLAAGDRLPVGALAAEFGTSEDSVRRDLRALAAAGRVRRVHGAALPVTSTGPLEGRATVAVDAKARIAARAAALVEDGMTVTIDTGTTALALARALSGRRGLVVSTNCLAVATVLSENPQCRVILAGGRVDPAIQATVGSCAVDAIRSIHADLCLIGPCSFDPVGGVGAEDVEEAEVKRAMLGSAATAVALATADKLGRIARHRVAPASAVHRLVTDTAVPAALTAAFATAGVDVLVAES